MVGYLILGIITVLIALALYLNKTIMYPETWTHEKALERELEIGLIDYELIKTYPVEEVVIDSDYGYQLYGRFYDFGHQDTVVICHGYGYNMIGSYKYMDIFIQKGFNVLLIDHRNHGKSGGTNTTFGYFEKKDLVKWIDWIKERKQGLIGTHGESMGAATVIQHASIDDRIDFVVADCPYRSVYSEFTHRVWKDYHFPPFLILWISSILHFISGNGLFSSISPIRVINKFKAPLFLIHGLADDYIKPSHSVDMFDERNKDKRLYLVPEAKHARSILVNKDQYYKEVHEFLDDYIIKES